VLLVAAGCATVGRRAPRPLLGAAVLVALVLALEAHLDFLRLERLRTQDLRALVTAAAAGEAGVLFSATGSPAAGRPPELLDEYVALAVGDLQRADEGSVGSLRGFVESGTSGVGLWIFRGPQARIDRTRARLDADPHVQAQTVGSGLLLVRSVAPEPAARLVAQAARVRRAWIESGQRDLVARRLLAVDRAALSSGR
jgi:hypothetical protein